MIFVIWKKNLPCVEQMKLSICGIIRRQRENYKNKILEILEKEFMIQLTKRGNYTKCRHFEINHPDQSELFLLNLAPEFS